VLFRNVPYTLGAVTTIIHGLGREPYGYLVMNGLKTVKFGVQTAPGLALELTVAPGEFVESYTAAGTVDSYTFSNLDGNVDVEYTLKGHWRKPNISGASSWLVMEPNSITTNQRTTALFTINGGAAADPVNTGLYCAYMSSAWSSNAVSSFESVFRAKTGDRRAFRTHSGAVRSYSADNLMYSGGGGWSDSTTEVTSLRIKGTRASDIGTNSYFELWKQVPTAKTLDIYIF
jgi:hypothetical protein